MQDSAGSGPYNGGATRLSLKSLPCSAPGLNGVGSLVDSSAPEVCAAPRILLVGPERRRKQWIGPMRMHGFALREFATIAPHGNPMARVAVQGRIVRYPLRSFAGDIG